MDVKKSHFHEACPPVYFLAGFTIRLLKEDAAHTRLATVPSVPLSPAPSLCCHFYVCCGIKNELLPHNFILKYKL